MGKDTVRAAQPSKDLSRPSMENDGLLSILTGLGGIIFILPTLGKLVAPRARGVLSTEAIACQALLATAPFFNKAGVLSRGPARMPSVTFYQEIILLNAFIKQVHHQS